MPSCIVCGSSEVPYWIDRRKLGMPFREPKKPKDHGLGAIGYDPNACMVYLCAGCVAKYDAHIGGRVEPAPKRKQAQEAQGG